MAKKNYVEIIVQAKINALSNHECTKWQQNNKVSRQSVHYQVKGQEQEKDKRKVEILMVMDITMNSYILVFVFPFPQCK